MYGHHSRLFTRTREGWENIDSDSKSRLTESAFYYIFYAWDRYQSNIYHFAALEYIQNKFS